MVEKYLFRIIYSIAEKTFKAAVAADSRGKTAAALAIVVSAALFSVMPQVYLARPAADELTWGARALTPWWFPEEKIADRSLRSPEYQRQYYFAIHHPSVARIVYRFALHRAGFYEPPEEAWEYGLGYNDNLALGHRLPYDFRLTLRSVNAAFFAGAVVFIYLSTALILANRFLAVVATLPFAFEPTISNGWKAVVPYIGADAIFLFFLAAFLYCLLRLKDKGLPGVLALGMIAGITVSTKVNGSFALIGALIYFAAYSRGWRRLAWPVILGAMSVAVFLALNPIYFGGGLSWAVSVFKDTLRLMFYLKETTTALDWGTYTRWETIIGAFPYLSFLVPIAIVVVSARREKWFPVVSCWSASIVVLNLFLVYMPQPRYAAPVRMAFFVILMASGLSLLRSSFATRRGEAA